MPQLQSYCPNCGHHFDQYEYQLQACGQCFWPENDEDDEEEFNAKDEFGLEDYYEDNE
jgi:hypothetical protein